jgi:hypothetical protein
VVKPTERIHKKKPDPKFIFGSITNHSVPKNKSVVKISFLKSGLKTMDQYPLRKMKTKNSHRYRIHKSRIRRLDPRNLNAGPGL